MTSSTHSRRSVTAAADEPRERILAAAGREFADHGYESATVRDICLAAGVNVAAVNYYFGDKRRLYMSAVRHAHEQRAREVPLPAWTEGTPSARKLHDFIDNLLERMLGIGQPSCEPSWQVRLLMREVLQPTDACRELVEDYVRPRFMQLVSILDEVVAGGLPQAELRRVALSIIGQCFLHRAAGDFVGMLLPRGEIETLHAVGPLADHVTGYALAALGLSPPLVRVRPSPFAPNSVRNDPA